MYTVSALLVHDILEYMVQIYLVVNNHRQRINNPFDEVLAFYFYSVERMGNFHYDPVEDVNSLKFTELVVAIGLSQYRDLI